MADEIIHEKVNEKVAGNIRRYAGEKTKQHIEKIVKEFTDRGFRKDDITPIVKEGIKEASK